MVAQLIGDLREVCAALPDKREGPRQDGEYSLADIGLSAFSLFFMGSPSFLAHQRAMQRGRGQSNCQTLFGMAAIPSDNSIRLMLDGVSPAAFDPLFWRAIDAAGPLTRFACVDGRILVALDGSEYFCSRKISCPQCSRRRRADGGVECFHAFLGATIVAPGHHQVLPLPPEFIAPQDGAEKQDCERNAAKRWLARHGAKLAHLRPIFLGDDLFACQPIAAAIQQNGGHFILTCKPSSHRTITEYLQGAELAEHRQTVRKGRTHTTTIYRWLSDVPLRDSQDALTVNWFSIEVRNAAGKRIYTNSFVTDLPISANTVAELAACGRARWKIENETFNVLKSNGYNLEHNFGHGKQTLASVFLALNLLAFAFHTAASRASLAWRDAVVACGATYRFFEELRTITRYVLFQGWNHLLQSIIASDLRPP